MSNPCNYSIKFYPLVEFNRTHLSKGDFEQWMKDNFSNADKILKEINGGSWSGASTPSNITIEEIIPSVARNAISTEGAEASIDSLYLGRTDLKLRMEQRFAEDIVTRTMFDLFGTGQWIDFNQNQNGISLGNKNIFEYKKQLFEALYEEMHESAPELRINMDPQEFSGTINLGLQAYRNYVNGHENAGSKFTEYAILQNFDSLLKAKAPFITFNENLQYDAIDKYQYKGPNVEHYTGYTSSEFAAIENQDSDLAKILLNIIPELNDKNAPITGSFVGLSGFNSAMMSLKRALQFSRIFPENLAKTYYDGINIDLDGLITTYVKELQNIKSKLPENQRSFLVGKLKGIQKFIYQSNIDKDIKNMFTQMFFKTEAIQYRAYTYDYNAGNIVGYNLRETLSNAQRYQLEDSIRGAVRLIRSNDNIKSELKDKYNLTVKDGVITLSSGMNDMTITYSDSRNHGKFDFQVSGQYTDQFAEKAIADFLSIIVPDTYTQVGIQLSGNTFRLMKDFAMPLGITILAAFDNNTGIFWKNKSQYIVDISKYNQVLMEPAKKLSVIYGSDTKNVVKSPSGSSLPLYQLTNLTYNINSLINDCKSIAKGFPNAYETHLFLTNPRALVTPQVRNEIMVGDITKSPDKLTVKELLQLSSLEDFYKPLMTDGIIYLQNATFADKSTHYLIGYDTNEIKLGKRTLQEALKDVIDGKSSSDILEFTRAQRKARLDRIIATVISDYRKVFLNIEGMFIKGVDGVDSTWNEHFNSLSDIDEFLKNATYNGKPITISDLNILFKNKDVTFHEEIHAYAPKIKSRGNARVNETMLNYQNIFNHKSEWNKRIEHSREQFINSISDNGWKWNKYDGGRMKELWDSYRSKLGFEWFDENTGEMKLHVGNQLHPVLEAFFAADILLSNEYNSLTIGEVWAHPNKNSNETNLDVSYDENAPEVGTYEEFSEANRLIAQIKRSVAFGATYHPFAQNQLNGVSDEIQIAVMDDIDAYVCTPNGYEDDELAAMDGAGIADALEARFENNSLLDARVGDNKKTIMMDVDRAYGKPILLKWAVYALTNEMRRNGKNSRASAELLCRKMRSKDIGTFTDVAQWYNERVNKIIFEDFYSGERYKILNVRFDEDNNVYVRDVINVTDDGKEIGTVQTQHIPDYESGEYFSSNTLYALDQLFGGAWTCEYDVENGWKYNEASTDMLEYILSKPTMQKVKKNGFIAYAVNKSAIKVGSGAVNSSEAFSDNSTLETITMRTRYGGVQMDADHELDMAEVTEGTQMISSLTEDGHYQEIVNQIYSDLGRVVAKHMEKYKINIDILAKKPITYHHPINKIISGAQTGVDTIGLEIGEELGLETGGTIAPNFEREQNIDNHSRTTLERLGVKEISSSLQGNNTGVKRWLPRTEQNVLNSDGTVYFASDADSAGLKATQRFANQYKKPFLLNPTAEELAKWIVDNNIEVLNVAGNRGSKLTPEMAEQIRQILREAIPAARSTAKQNVISEADVKHNEVLAQEQKEAREKLHQLLGESLIAAFSTGSKDTLGLAQAFLKKASEAIKNAQEFKIPFSAATINGSFIADVVSSINRGGIRHKYEGFAGVLNPSYNMVQYYQVWNPRLKRFENRMFPQLAQLIREQGRNLNVDQVTAIPIDYVLNFDKDGNDTNNPFIRQVYNWNDLQFEDTVILNYPNGMSRTVYLNTFDKLDELKALWRVNPSLIVGLHTARPRNLRGVETRFKVAGKEYSYYDLNSVRAIFYLNKLTKAFKDKKDLNLAWNSLKKYQRDFLETEGITRNIEIDSIPSKIKQLQKDTQSVLKSIEEGREFYGLLPYSVKADSWYTRPAEIIMGRYQMKKFGLNNNDHIFNVTDASFFREKLENKYNLPDEDKISGELYDVVLYKGNRKFFVKIGDNPNETYSKFNRISDNSDFTINGNSVWFEDLDITTPNGKLFKTYINDYGEKFDLISVNSIETYNELVDSGIFDTIEVMNYTDENLDILKQLQFGDDTVAELHIHPANYWVTVETPIQNINKQQLELDWEIRKRELITKKASNMYDSFQKSLDIVGARIPTQAMQSFMPMRVVAFTDVETNAVYVPAAQTALQGSDYDIDKLYIMAHSVDDNGIVSIGSRLQSRLGLDIVSKLVPPTNIIYTEGDSNIIVSYNEIRGVLGRDYMTSEQVIDVLNRIYNGNGNVTFVDMPKNQGQANRLKKQFLNLVNSHSRSKRDVKGNALKNRIVSAINRITLAPQNQLIAQVPVDMGEPKKAAKASKLGRAEMHITSDNPETKFMMQVQNMVGKEVIGISAVSLKAFFGLSYFYNQKVQDVKNAISNGNIQSILNTLSALVFANPLTGEITSLANIDIEQLYDLNPAETMSIDSQVVSDKLYEWILKTPEQIYDALGNNTVSENVKITNWNNLKGFTQPFDGNGDIISTRLNSNSIESFGNTFTPRADLMRDGMIKVDSVSEAVTKYILAVLTSNDPHYMWIRNQCISGNLKGKTIWYYSELNEPSHATALDYLINKFNWNAWQSLNDAEKMNVVYGNSKYFQLKQCIDDLTERVNRNDAALTISAIISAATDNAKELILAKINATSNLVDIYTYLTGIGIPFNEIADLMVTDSLQFLSKLGESNIFDSSSSKYSVKDILKYYTGIALPKGVQRDVITTYLTIDKTGIGNTIMNSKDLLRLLQADGNIRDALKNLYEALHLRPLSGETIDQRREWLDQMIAGNAYPDSIRDTLLDPYKTEELRSAIKFLETTLQMIEYKRTSGKKDYEKIKKLVNILDGVEEMSKLGRSLGINQGMPTDLYGLRNAIKNISEYVGDFDSFITDSEYRQNAISTYKTKTYNLPEVISSIPHFWEMIQTMYYAKEMLNGFSIKNRTVWDLANKIEGSTKYYTMSESDFRALQNYINDVLIATFLKESKFEVFISPDAKIITSITGDKNYSLETRRLKLDSAINVAAFKNWMDTYVIPMIIKDYAGNPFVDELRPLANVITSGGREKELTGWKFPFNLTEADKSPTTQQIYGAILKGFNDIANQGASLFGQSIGDLFYVYNMIVNKDSFGQTSFTKIFEDLVQNNSNSIVNQYNEYVSKLDESDSAKLTVSIYEAMRRIKKYNPDSRLNVSVGLDFGPDFVLDLQEFYELPNNNVISPDKLSTPKIDVPAYKYTLDQQSLVVEMVKQLNKRLPDSEIHLITDDELIDFKDLNQYEEIAQSKGFILNGEIYINLSRMSGATLLHEFSHVVLAAIKANPETRSIYYQLVTSVKDLSEFDEIAKMYPNHVGSDLYEEVFAHILEMYLDNKEYIPSNATDSEDRSNVLYATTTNNKEAVLQAMSYLLGLDNGIVKLEDIISKPITEILDRFGFNLLNSSVPISKTVVINSQKQNTIKQELFKDNKLNMKCDE